MSSSRKSRSERLYTLSRRELQALCNQYGIPTNRSNVAMVEALSACAPVDSGKPKTWTGAHSSRKFKATPSKGDGGAATPLSGKRKLSPVEMVEREEASLLNPSTTPVRRGMKRSERPPLQTPREENSKAAFSRGSAGFAPLDRFGKSVAATSRPTPGKRPGIIRRGREAIQPVTCTEIEFRNADLHKELFGGHTNVEYGHEFTPVERRPYPSESSEEIGFEFRDMALHKELFGPSSTAVPSVFISPLTSSPAHAMVPSVFVSPLTSSPEVLDYSGHAIRLLSSVREEEDAGDGSGKKDLGPLLDEMEDDLLVKEATPLTKIRNNIGCTLAKATSILERLAAMRVDAEKKRREGYWEPKFSFPPAVFQTALMVDRDLPSAKKARLTPKALPSSETELVVYEDAEGETPAKRVCIPTDDKENQHWKSRKTGKEKKSKQHDVLKDRSKNVDSGSNKLFLGELRPEEMSLRKLRAQFKDRIRQLEASKASDLRPWSERVARITPL